MAAQGGDERLASSRTDLGELEHRLRTRVTVARGWVDLVLRGALDGPDDVDDALRVVRRQLSDLEQFLRNATRSGLNGVEGGVGPVKDLREAVEETLAEYAWSSSPAVREPAVLGTPRSLPVEHDALHDVLLHLLDNAVEHTPDGTRVEVILDYRSETVELRVEDAGPGLLVDLTQGQLPGSGLEVVRRIAAGLGASVRAVPSSRLGGAALCLRWDRSEEPASM
jgi:two-component system, OmpR family, sensor kinase